MEQVKDTPPMLRIMLLQTLVSPARLQKEMARHRPKGGPRQFGLPPLFNNVGALDAERLALGAPASNAYLTACLGREGDTGLQLVITTCGQHVNLVVVMRENAAIWARIEALLAGFVDELRATGYRILSILCAAADLTLRREMLVFTMNRRLTEMKRRVRAGEHRVHRQASVPDVQAEADRLGLSWAQRAALLTRRMCEAELSIIAADERIVFARTLPTVPALYTAADMAALTRGRTLHELGPINNICADWGLVLAKGLLGRRQVAVHTRQRLAHDAAAIEFLDGAIEAIDAVL